MEAQTVIEPYVVEDGKRGLFRVNRRTFVDPDILEREQRLKIGRAHV